MSTQPTMPTTPEVLATFQEQLRTIEINAHQAGLGYDFLLMAAKRQFVIGALARNRWNQCHAARDLKMHRNTLSRTMEELRITVPGKMKITRGCNKRQAQSAALRMKKPGEM